VEKAQIGLDPTIGEDQVKRSKTTKIKRENTKNKKPDPTAKGQIRGYRAFWGERHGNGSDVVPLDKAERGAPSAVKFDRRTGTWAKERGKEVDAFYERKRRGESGGGIVRW